ncbi:hypothetical protein Tco_1167710 [Tanacetum coccineum]
MEVSRLSGMDNDLFTYKVEVANIPCNSVMDDDLEDETDDDMGYDPSDEKVMAQLKEMKRLADLKAEKEKSKKLLKKILNPATIRAQTQKMAEHEAKSKIPVAEDKKRKRIEILKEVFVTENVIVDGLHRNLVPPLGIEGRQRLVIREPKSGIFFYNGNWDLRALQTYSSQRHRQGSRRLLEDTLVSWDGYQLRSAVSISCPDKFSCKLDSLIKFTCSKSNLT